MTCNLFWTLWYPYYAVSKDLLLYVLKLKADHSILHKQSFRLTWNNHPQGFHRPLHGNTEAHMHCIVDVYIVYYFRLVLGLVNSNTSDLWNNLPILLWTGAGDACTVRSHVLYDYNFCFTQAARISAVKQPVKQPKPVEPPKDLNVVDKQLYEKLLKEKKMLEDSLSQVCSLLTIQVCSLLQVCCGLLRHWFIVEFYKQSVVVLCQFEA